MGGQHLNDAKERKPGPLALSLERQSCGRELMLEEHLGSYHRRGMMACSWESAESLGSTLLATKWYLEGKELAEENSWGTLEVRVD